MSCKYYELTLKERSEVNSDCVSEFSMLTLQNDSNTYHINRTQIKGNITHFMNLFHILTSCDLRNEVTVSKLCGSLECTIMYVWEKYYLPVTYRWWNISRSVLFFREKMLSVGHLGFFYLQKRWASSWDICLQWYHK